MEIPKQVIDAASNEVSLGGQVVFECEYKGEQVYDCSYEEEMSTGLPIFYLWNGSRVKVVDGTDGENLLGDLIKAQLL